VADNILTLALPEKSVQPTRSNIDSLKEKLKALSLYPFEKRVEKSIQDMCIELKKLISQSWAKYFSYEYAEIEKILERSIKRMQDQQ